MATNKPAHEPNQAWIEEEILYVTFRDELSLKTIMKMEEVASQLLKQQQKAHMPVVVIMDKLADSEVKIGLSDLGKIVSSTGIVKHLSAILVVGAGEAAKRVLGMLNGVFFSNRIRFYETLKEAQTAARASISASLSILEQG